MYFKLGWAVGGQQAIADCMMHKWLHGVHDDITHWRTEATALVHEMDNRMFTRCRLPAGVPSVRKAISPRRRPRLSTETDTTAYRLVHRSGRIPRAAC